MAYNYRLPELCAAVALAQTENMEFYCQKRIDAANGDAEVIEETQTDLLIPQKTPDGFKNSYYTYGVLYNGIDYGIEWQTFRKNILS